MDRGNIAISGFVKPGFEAVRSAFIDNFVHRKEVGAACCMYRNGERVVDLWGGVRNKSTGEPWLEDTMVIVFSATKGMSGLAIALAHSRGLLDYEERVSTYWPEFAQQGKENVTVRQLLSHQAGLFGLDTRMERSLIADLDRLAIVLAKQKPEWEPGTRQAYHALTVGFYEGELLRRVDPTHRSLGRFFQDEIATPLGLDFYIRLPEEIPKSRLATMEKASVLRALLDIKLAIPIIMSAINPRSLFSRTMDGTWIPVEEERVYARELEVPAGGGVGTARAMAHAYSVFATGGRELGLRHETLTKLMAPAVAPTLGFHDECLNIEWKLSLGFTKPNREYPFGRPGAFGAPGAGGSFGYADPELGVGYAYVMNRMGTKLKDPRELAIRNAFHRALNVELT